MKTARNINIAPRKGIPYEHLEFILKNTTASQRLNWLEEAWNFNRAILKNKSKPAK